MDPVKSRSFVTTVKGKVNLEMRLMVSGTVVEEGQEPDPPTLGAASSPNPVPLLLLNPKYALKHGFQGWPVFWYIILGSTPRLTFIDNDKPFIVA